MKVRGLDVSFVLSKPSCDRCAAAVCYSLPQPERDATEVMRRIALTA